MKQFLASLGIVVVILALSVGVTSKLMGGNLPPPPKSPICRQLARDAGETLRVMREIKNSEDSSRSREYRELSKELSDLLKTMRKEKCK